MHMRKQTILSTFSPSLSTELASEDRLLIDEWAAATFTSCSCSSATVEANGLSAPWKAMRKIASSKAQSPLPARLPYHFNCRNIKRLSFVPSHWKVVCHHLKRILRKTEFIHCSFGSSGTFLKKKDLKCCSFHLLVSSDLVWRTKQ